ncbi:unnamed protein product, partial [Closterium sp. NIES-53]
PSAAATMNLAPWAADGLPEDLPVPSYPPPNKKRPHPSKQNREAAVDCKVGVRSSEFAENVPRHWYLPKVPVRMEVAEG